MRLQNKVAIVTGAASGLGRAMAQRFAAEGAAVVIADIHQDAIDVVVGEINDAGHSALGFTVDVRNRAQLKDLMAMVKAKLGRIDILVNSAGITRPQPFLELADPAWDIVLAVDLKGVFFCVQAVAPVMTEQGYGKIVNISSTAGTGAGQTGIGGSQAGNCNYAAAKAGVIQLTRSLARELGPHGINVNCIAPGFIVTPLTYSTRSPEVVEKHLELRKKTVVLNRVGKPEDIANAVLFLVSDEASFISGQLLCVDGGRTDRM